MVVRAFVVVRASEEIGREQKVKYLVYEFMKVTWELGLVPLAAQQQIASFVSDENLDSAFFFQNAVIWSTIKIITWNQLQMLTIILNFYEN